jgi:hypothetical protein
MQLYILSMHYFTEKNMSFQKVYAMNQTMPQHLE